MNKQYYQQKNLLLLGISFFVLLINSSIAIVFYFNQTSLLLENEQKRLKNEARIIGHFLKDPLLRFDYAEAINFLKDWKKNKPDISHLEITLGNNKTLFDYKKDKNQSISIEENFKAGQYNYSVVIAYNISQLHQHFQHLQKALIISILLVTAIMITILWYLLSHWIIKPLNHEISRQTTEVRKYSTFIDSILDSISSHIAIIDQKGLILRTNDSWAKYARKNGYNKDPSMIGMSYFQNCGIDDQPGQCKKKCDNPYECGVMKVIHGELDEFVSDYDCFSSDKKEWYNIRANPFLWSNERLIIISHENITNIKFAQSELEHQSYLLEKVNRAYMALSKTNLSLIQSKNTSELYQSVCDIVHQDCQFELVWIGVPLDNEEKDIEIVASSGISQDYLKEICVGWADNAIGHGPVGRSIRSKKSVICNDITTNPDFLPWKESAEKYNFASCASFPIVWNDSIISALSVYSKHRNSFSQQETDLMQELAGNVAFGIKSLEDRHKIQLLSITDPLTQTFNRRHIQSTLEAEISRYHRYANNLSLIILDIDYFKKVNDQHGHQVGDQILIEFAQLLKQCCRTTDIVGRWGGEEFIILLPDTDQEKASALAERIREKIEKFNFTSVGHKTASLGVATLHKSDSSDSLIERTDHALYQAKNNGRNQIKVAV